MQLSIGSMVQHFVRVTIITAVTLTALTCRAAGSRIDYCEFGNKMTLLVVDRTTFYDDTDRQTLVDGLKSLYDDLGVGDRLVVHTITDDRAKSDKIFDSCYPGCPEGGLVSWLVSSCRAGLARSDLIDFKRDLAGKLRPVLLEHEKYPRSAIIETLTSVTALYYTKGLGRVVIFSDLLENSLIFPWPMIVTRRSELMLRDATKLKLIPYVSEIPVVVFGVGRKHDRARSPLPARQRYKLEEFWRGLLGSAGAESIAIGEWYQ